MNDYEYGYDGMTEKALSEKMQRGWVSKETPCGSGSEKGRTKHIIKCLREVVKNYNIQSISDAGAGDLYWFPKDLNVDYKGYDLFPRHEEVIEFDMTKEVLPKTDLILCRFVLNHLSVRMVKDSLENFKKSGSTYLLITNWNRPRKYWKEHNFEIQYKLIESWQEYAKGIQLELYKIN